MSAPEQFLTVTVEDALLCEIALAQAATDQALERLKAARRAELAAHDEAASADAAYGDACERQRKIERVLQAYQNIDRKVP